MTVINTNIAETINIGQNGTYDVARYTTANVSVGGSGKYELFQRVKDDNNVEIGTVVGFRKDSNNNEYAVVCLDNTYRSVSYFTILSTATQITDLPHYTSINVYEAKETATYNCDKILAQATTSGLTSGAVSECRNHSFVIDGITYYGQVPSLVEMVYILLNRTTINTKDPSGSIGASSSFWTSTAGESTRMWTFRYWGQIGDVSQTQSSISVIPILEIPNA